MNIIALGDLIKNIPYEAPYKKVQTYLFNRNTSEFEQKIEVINSLGISEEDFYFWEYNYLPLPDVSFAQTQRDFLMTCNMKDAPKILEEYSDDKSLEGYFSWAREYGYEIASFWRQHHLSVMKYIAIEWCKDYKIPYTDDLPEIKPVKMIYSVVSQ